MVIEGKKMLFLTSFPGGVIIPVTALQRKENGSDHWFILFENGSTDTTTEKFLFDYDERLRLK